MDELFMGEATMAGEKSWQGMVPLRLHSLGESPLSRALHRRRGEIDSPEVVVVTHDSMI